MRTLDMSAQVRGRRPANARAHDFKRRLRASEAVGDGPTPHAAISGHRARRPACTPCERHTRLPARQRCRCDLEVPADGAEPPDSITFRMHDVTPPPLPARYCPLNAPV